MSTHAVSTFQAVSSGTIDAERGEQLLDDAGELVLERAEIDGRFSEGNDLLEKEKADGEVYGEAGMRGATMLDEELDEREKGEEERAVTELAKSKNAVEQRGANEEIHIVARLHQKRQQMKKLFALLGGELRALGKTRSGDEDVIDAVFPLGEDADYVHK